MRRDPAGLRDLSSRVGRDAARRASAATISVVSDLICSPRGPHSRFPPFILPILPLSEYDVQNNSLNYTICPIRPVLMGRRLPQSPPLLRINHLACYTPPDGWRTHTNCEHCPAHSHRAWAAGHVGPGFGGAVPCRNSGIKPGRDTESESLSQGFHVRTDPSGDIEDITNCDIL